MREQLVIAPDEAARIVSEALALVNEGYSSEEAEVGLLRWPGRPEKRVDALVWLSVRSMVAGIGIATARQLHTPY